MEFRGVLFRSPRPGSERPWPRSSKKENEFEESGKEGYTFPEENETLSDRTTSTLTQGPTGRNLDYLYDQHLLAQGREAVEAIENFQNRLAQGPVKFGRFTIPTFYKPHLLSPKQEHLLKRVNSVMMEIVNTATRLYFDHPQLRHYFQLSPEAAELVEIDPGYPRNVILTRFDAFLEGESFKIIE